MDLEAALKALEDRDYLAGDDELDAAEYAVDDDGDWDGDDPDAV